jgi:hypothetical protein
MELAFFLLLLFWLTSGFIAASVAKAKGWSGSSWFWAGFLLGPAGLLGALGMPDRLLRKYLRQIAAYQGALGSELLNDTFTTTSGAGDDAWNSILSCVNPAVAQLLSRSNSTIYPRYIEIRDIEGFDVGRANVVRGEEGDSFTWKISLDR